MRYAVFQYSFIHQNLREKISSLMPPNSLLAEVSCLGTLRALLKQQKCICIHETDESSPAVSE